MVLDSTNKKDEENEMILDFLQQTNFSINAVSNETGVFYNQILAETNNPTYKPFERPDAVLANESSCIGIECLSFDSSRNEERLGSVSRSLQKKNEAELQNLKPDGRLRNSSFETETDKAYYLNNFLLSFKKHSKNIGAYLNNIKVAFPNRKHYYLMFLIEDDSCLPNFQITKGEVKRISFFEIKEVIKELMSAQGIDFVVDIQSDSPTGKIAFIASPGDYQNLLKNSRSFSEIELWTSKKVNIISINTTVKKKN